MVWMPSMLALGACVAMHPLEEPETPSGHHFDYHMGDREQVNLVQVFDDGMKTYLQFQGQAGGVEVFQGADDAPIPYETEQRFVILNGVFETLRIMRAGHSVLVSNRNPVLLTKDATEPSTTDSQSKGSTAMNLGVKDLREHISPLRVSDWGSNYLTGVSPASVGVPESLQTMHANSRVALLEREIASLEDRVRKLTQQIEEAHGQERGRSVYVRTTAGLPRIALTFANNSERVVIDDDLREGLGAAARAANRIYLHGHTDAYVASEAGTVLAIGRAAQVRSLLASMDVDLKRIRLFYRGAGNFAANNSTEEGKSLNRRVEVELRKW